MADTKEPTKVMYRFGNFEVAPETGELFRRGQRIKIQALAPEELNVSAYAALILANTGDEKQAEALSRKVQAAPNRRERWSS